MQRSLSSPDLMIFLSALKCYMGGDAELTDCVLPENKSRHAAAFMGALSRLATAGTARPSGPEPDATKSGGLTPELVARLQKELQLL